MEINSLAFKHSARCVDTGGLNQTVPHCHPQELQDTLHGAQHPHLALRQANTAPPSERATQVQTYFQTRVVNELERKGIKPIMSSLRKQLEFMGHLLLIIGTHTIVHACGWL